MGIRSLITVLICLLASFGVEALGSQMDLKRLTIADIPPCGLRCLLLKLPASGCTMTDIDCVCANEQLEYALAACLLMNCTMQDSLSTSRVQADLCNLSTESKTQDVILYTSIVYSIAFISVALRVIGKLVSKRLSWDDAMVLAALLLTLVPLGCVLDMAVKGFGKHLWDLEDDKLLPILRDLYISWSTYIIILCMIKISLVLFYIEIFKTPRFQLTAYIFLAYIITNSLVLFFVAAFACSPVYSFWERDIKGKCINIQAMAYSTSASAIVQDIILLILPLAFIRNLQMKRHRKIAVGFMFCIGTFGCIATIMRLPSLSTFQISIDPSWDYVPVTVWTELELAAGFLCVSLPSIRMLLVTVLPERIKGFLSNITRPSRNKSNPTPQQAAPIEHYNSKTPLSSIDTGANRTCISSNNGRGIEPLTLGLGVRESFMGAFWNRSSTQPSQFSDLRSGSRRLKSSMSNHSQSGVAATRPAHKEYRSDSRFEPAEPVELLVLPKSHRPTSRSEDSRTSNGEVITALPQIGCLPKAASSETELVRKG